MRLHPVAAAGCRGAGKGLEKGIVKPHECRVSQTCSCSITADEPDEYCPVHDVGEWPPRCERCGHFIKRQPYEDLTQPTGSQYGSESKDVG